VLPEFESLGATLVAITPQVAEQNQALVKKRGLSFRLLSDPGNRVASAFRLTFRLPDDLESVYRGFNIELPAYNGDDSWTLPMPARYVIDTGGRIRAADVNADYTRRPEPEEAVKAIARLAAKPDDT
jgi:peroxiredoxin